MIESSLKPFIRPGLDILFVGLNPPIQSNTHGHYFSGKQSRFYYLLTQSGLLTTQIDKRTADTLVFGSTEYNYNSAQFGVIDLLPSLVETDSSKVRTGKEHVKILISTIKTHQPRFVCIIHGKVRDAFNTSAHSDILKPLTYGNNGVILRDCLSVFFVNYFPNGNAIPDNIKIQIFQELRSLI